MRVGESERDEPRQLPFPVRGHGASSWKERERGREVVLGQREIVLWDRMRERERESEMCKRI